MWIRFYGKKKHYLLPIQTSSLTSNIVFDDIWFQHEGYNFDDAH